MHSRAHRYAVLMGARSEIRRLPIQQRILLALWLYWDDVPWAMGRLFGCWIFGIGILIYAEPNEVIHYGWAFLGPIIHQVWPLVIAIGAFQMVVEILRAKRLRLWAAFPACGVYASVMILTNSPTGHLAYGIGFLAETLIILKRA